MNNSNFNQAVIFHFALSKNDRVYVFQVTPGSPWDEIDQAFDEFKAEFHKLKENALKAEEQKAQELKPEQLQEEQPESLAMKLREEQKLQQEIANSKVEAEVPNA